MDCRSPHKRVSVIGTGDFGRAIGKRLASSGYDVIFGSRRPESLSLSSINATLATVKVTTIQEAIQVNEVVVFALRIGNFEDVVRNFRDELDGKIIVDVSNRSKSTRVLTSNAEVLQRMVPEATVVKAFNVVSAYALDADFDGSSRVVPIASDNCRARVVVSDIARDMGFQPYDAGMLEAARSMEDFVVKLFPMWRFPVICAVSIFIMWWLYAAYLYYIRVTAYEWEQIFVKVMNKPLCMTAVTLLGLTYLPGCLAGFLQLMNGTKRKRFPNWLDFWLRSRKQLGLTCFALAAMHALISVMLLSPTYYKSWFHHETITIPTNLTSDLPLTLPATSWMTWKGEIACLTGLLTFAIMCVLAVTSLPTVGDSLNWVEWRFVQSKLGVAALFVAISHIYVMGMPAWIENSSFIYLIHSITFTSSLLPTLVLLMRLILATPPISTRLKKIRHGWESNSAKRDLEAASEKPDFNKNQAKYFKGHFGELAPEKHELLIEEKKCVCINHTKNSECCKEKGDEIVSDCCATEKSCCGSQKGCCDGKSKGQRAIVVQAYQV